MLATKRTSLEIMAEILTLCKQPQSKTRVMYRTNLSYKALGRYLSQLQSVKFLEIHHSVPRYATTQKGLEFLEKWQELQNLLSS